MRLEDIIVEVLIAAQFRCSIAVGIEAEFADDAHMSHEDQSLENVREHKDDSGVAFSCKEVGAFEGLDS